MTNLKNNPLKTKQDLEEALLDLVQPVYDLMIVQEKSGRVHLGDSGSVYDQDRQEVEGFLRTLWGMGPLFSNKEKTKTYETLFTLVNQGILAGTTPKNKNYWGRLKDYDQLFVEMGALATYLILTKEIFFFTLSKNEQKQICLWLEQINQHTIPPTNWLFFRILVNTFFETINYGHPQEQLSKDLAEIQQYYLAKGWYFDGYKNQIDYYIPFGMQYYGLLYTVLSPKKNPPYLTEFKERAAMFGESFKEWFVKNGAALPFGRSLTYRFAQSSFYAVAAFAKQEFTHLKPEEGKYLVLQNMRYWFSQPIFTTDHLLSIGYAYPNLVMAEGYNAPGSPYWAMKNFILLGIPDEDNFWNLEEKCPSFSSFSLNPYSRMILVHDEKGEELQSFTAGQHSHEHAHGQAKYEKFVYSTTFGFSVPKDNVLPKQGAYDNTLAVSETETNFITPFGFSDYAIYDNYTYSLWEPYPGVSIKSFIVPCYPWHIRLHKIITNRPLHLLAGSFSTPKVGQIKEETQESFVENAIGSIGIKLFTPGKSEITQPEPNTNLLYSQTYLPLGHFKVTEGEQTILLSCLGNAGKKLSETPDITAQLTPDNVLHYSVNGKKQAIHLKEA